LRSYSRHTRALLSWIESVGAALTDDVFRGRDAVHFDFHPGNVLVAPDADRVAGVVDWAGARVGDCALDLVTLARAPGDFVISSAVRLQGSIRSPSPAVVRSG
jgi:aminoglycoside phosphotransferase (APT) family kinase protein